MPSSKPNILFITLDDMNDWVGCLNGYSGPVHTPHIDALANRGRLFANAHCPAPLCNPSRTAVLSGLRPSTTGIYDNTQWWRPSLPDTVMLPEHFKAHGYQTACSGKVLHHTPGFNPPEMWDELFQQAFDLGYVTGEDPSAPPSGQPMTWRPGYPLNGLEEVRTWQHPPGGTHEFDWGQIDLEDQETGDGQAACWAADYLSRQHNKPFFLAVGSFRPHLPWYVPRKYLDLYPLDDIVPPDVLDDDLNDVPPAGRKLVQEVANAHDLTIIQRNGLYKIAIQAYLASLSYSDAIVGMVLDALAKSDYYQNTYVVLWVDHGFHMGEKGYLGKSTLWERSTRIPLIIAGPDVAKPGVCTRQAVSSLDIYPTLNELCGFTPKPELEGESLLPLLSDPNTKREQPAITTIAPGAHSARSERWRYIRYADGSEELYDHQSDPNEWDNLADKPELQVTKDQLAAALPQGDAAPAPDKSGFAFDASTYTWTRTDSGRLSKPPSR